MMSWHDYTIYAFNGKKGQIKLRKQMQTYENYETHEKCLLQIYYELKWLEESISLFLE